MNLMQDNSSLATHPFVRLAQRQEMMYVVLVVTSLDLGMTYFHSPCTGTLLQKDLVLTTVSCLQIEPESPPDPSTIYVYTRQSEQLRTKEVFIRPNQDKKNYDVVLVFCHESKISTFPKLPQAGVKLPFSCVVGGYGSRNKISLKQFTILPFKFYNNKLLPCRGDVGAPMVCEDVLYGIYNPLKTPQRHLCIDRYATHFTRVLPLVNWIDKVVQSKSEFDLSWLASPWYILLISATVLALLVIIYNSIIFIAKRKYSILI